MDETERILAVLAEFVPREVLELCNLLEERTKHLGMFNAQRNVADKLISALREKCDG